MLLKQLILFVWLLHEAHTGLFSSAYCAPNSCSGLTKTSCSACDAPYMYSAGTCVLDPNSNYLFLADESTIGNSKIGDTASCSAYSYYGNFDNSNNPRLSYSSTITQPHYAVRLIMWVIMIDQWDPTTDGI